MEPGALGSYQRMAEQVLATDTTRDAFARLILDLVWAGFQAQRRG